MALTIDIKVNNEMEMSALRAAAALDKVAEHEKVIDILTKKISVSYQKVAVSAQKVATANEKAEKKADALNDKAKSLANKEEANKKKSIAAINKQLKATEKYKQEEKKHNDAVKKGAEAFIGVKIALLAATAGAIALGVAIAKSAKSAYDSKANALALMNAWTGQRGSVTLENIDKWANYLGKDIDETRKQFIAFREAGVNNKMAVELIKLQADLQATGLDADRAKQEISGILANVGNPGAFYYKMKRARDDFHALGTGAQAAAKSITTVEGAENALKNTASKQLAKIWEKIGPAVGKALNVFAEWINKKLDGENAKKAIDGIADSVIGLAEKVEAGLGQIDKAFENVNKAMDRFEKGYNKVSSIIQDNSAGIKAGLAIVGAALAVVFGPAIVAAIGGIAVTFAAAAAGILLWPAAIAAAAIGVGYVVQKIVDHWDEIKELPGKMYAYGADIVYGLINGVKDKINGAINTVKEFANSISDAFASALGIHSPSRLFMNFGKQTVAGFEKGETQAIGKGSMPLQNVANEAPKRAVIPAPEVASEAPRASAPESNVKPYKEPSQKQLTTGYQSTTSSAPSITIENINVAAGSGDAQEIAQSIRRELQLLLQAGALSRGAA